MTGLWYAIVSFTLLMFVVLEGFDFGAGMLLYVVGRNEAERRVVIAAIGPLWSWNEVWLVSFGGTLLLAFPVIMAASFSGFYMAMFLLVWAMLLRGVSLELSGHIPDPLWRTAWYLCFVASNVLLATLVGAALGNVLRGVPLGPDGKFCLPLFTNFSPTGHVGILDWYTLSIALFILATFAAHGAAGLAQRTAGTVRFRCMNLAASLSKLVLAALAIVTFETWRIRPDVFSGLTHQPLGWLGLVFVLVGISEMFAGLRHGHESQAKRGSSTFIAGIMVAGAAGVFPVILRSTIAPQYSLSVYGSAADNHGLAIAIVWWPIACLLSIGYCLFIFRYYRGKTRPADDGQRPY